MIKKAEAIDVDWYCHGRGFCIIYGPVFKYLFYYAQGFDA